MSELVSSSAVFSSRTFEPRFEVVGVPSSFHRNRALLAATYPLACFVTGVCKWPPFVWPGFPQCWQQLSGCSAVVRSMGQHISFWKCFLSFFIEYESEPSRIRRPLRSMVATDALDPGTVEGLS